MTEKEAQQIIDSFDESRNTSDADFFLATEAFHFLIEKNHDPATMLHLGGYYYDMKLFDLALKYYEMAASYDYDRAFEALGYFWYYGRSGKRDFKKAFECFSRLKDKGEIVATYKVADMYKNGYYVEKNQKKYEQMIEELYIRVKDMNNVFDPVPEVVTRLARIRTAQGREEEAIDHYLYAKDFLAQRIRFNPFFGYLNTMKWLIDDLYELIEFDEDFFDFYDLFYLLKTPHKVTFIYEGEEQKLESVLEGEECSICFNGKWFASRDEFFKGAHIEDMSLTEIYRDLYGFEVM